MSFQKIVFAMSESRWNLITIKLQGRIIALICMMKNRRGVLNNAEGKLSKKIKYKNAFTPSRHNQITELRFTKVKFI
jgi:hypothetical protein